MIPSERNVEEINYENENGLNYYLKQKWKLGVTLFCLFSFITMGIHLEISGSTMLPLSHQIGTNLSHLSWIVAARSFGYMISVILLGVICQPIIKHHSALTLAIGYLIPAAATALTPHLKSLWTLCLALFCQGMLQGLSDLAINTLVTKMWLDRSTAPLNCVYLGYAIGALLSIFIVRFFRQNTSFITNSIKSSNSTMIIKDREFQSDLIGPYTIASIFCLISSIGFAWIAYQQYHHKNKSSTKEKIRIYQSVAKEEIHIQSKPKRVFNKTKFWKTCSPTTCGQGFLAYGFSLISLLLLFNFFFGGIEQGFSKFFISFVEQEQINLNRKDAIYSMVFYWLPMLVGRILCTFLTVSYLSPELMLTLSLLFCLLTYLLWIIFLWYIGLTRLSLFILVTSNGLSISSISPTMIGWMKQFLNLSPIELTLILSSNSIGGIVFGLISGYVFDHYGSKHLFTILILAMILCSIFFIFASILQYIHSNNQSIDHQQQQQQQDQTLEIFIEQQPIDQHPMIKYIDQ